MSWIYCFGNFRLRCEQRVGENTKGKSSHSVQSPFFIIPLFESKVWCICDLQELSDWYERWEDINYNPCQLFCTIFSLLCCLHGWSSNERTEMRISWLRTCLYCESVCQPVHTYLNVCLHVTESNSLTFGPIFPMWWKSLQLWFTALIEVF